MVKHTSLKELLFRMVDKSQRARELRNSLKNSNITPGKKQALTQSLKLLENQVKTLIKEFNQYGEGDILEITFEVYYHTGSIQKYRKKFLNLSPEEAEGLVRYKYSANASRVEILELKVLPTSQSLEKL